MASKHTEIETIWFANLPLMIDAINEMKANSKTIFNILKCDNHGTCTLTIIRTLNESSLRLMDFELTSNTSKYLKNVCALFCGKQKCASFDNECSVK